MIESKDLKKGFESAGSMRMILKGIDVKISDGEFVSIMGKSGAGKSTLMYQLSLLDTPTEGDVIVEGKGTMNWSERKRSNYRLENLGYIFQNYALMPELTALEQIVGPLYMLGWSKREAKEQAQKALESLGIGDKGDNLPSQLSGGEQQRVSIARAIAKEPKVLFADEPTANLDTANSEIVLNILSDLNKQGITIVMVTHERDYALYAKRIIEMEDGKILKDKKVTKRKVK